MIRLFVVAVSGLLFGAGLIISGMINPAKVIGFLDLTGNWDLSLAFVMGGAIPVAALGFWLARGWNRPLLADTFSRPRAGRVDLRLSLGAILFGIGWGLAGYCPGPALASLSLGSSTPILFVAAMLAGMVVFPLFDRATQRRLP